jgi:predicted nuclease of restriction endonuclease-like RecB superfamily
VTPISPAELREQLFARGPAFPTIDLFHQQTRQDIIRTIAKSLRTSQRQIEATLFADRPDEHTLADAGPEWSPETLLTRYNLELSRGALYWASQMQIEIHDNYKDIWRYIKLFKLMFEARALEGGGYHLDLDGPISPFVTHTLRYGRQFAAFLPALFLCERWQMMATVHSPQIGRSHETLLYRLDHTTPLQSHFKRSGLFDSRLERDLAAEFEEKFGGDRGQWTLTREDEVLLLGSTVMIPDFAITNKRDGRRAIVEIVGFWHPDYLRRKVAKVRAANRRDLILLVYEGINLSQEQLQDVPGEVLYFKNKPVLKDVMAAVEAVAQ